MADQNDPGRARRLALLRQVEGELSELFAHANAQPEPKRCEARTFLRDIFTRAAMTPGDAARAPSAPTSGPRKVEPRPAAVVPANDAPKGPPCARCAGAGLWKGSNGRSGPCFGCKGSGVARQRAGGAR